MNLSVIVATLEGCSPALLDDPTFMAELLGEVVAAGGFTLLHQYVHHFVPQGVTGAAVLSESHIALHSWPEHGILFVDMASCSGEDATRAAFARLCALVPHTAVRNQHCHQETLSPTDSADAGRSHAGRTRVDAARAGSDHRLSPLPPVTWIRAPVA